ncbi:quinoprotein relay system zinc metallohydrolase 1 [Ectopseudomonas mendocina]|uniref:Quinoprotein relay system zinc metallohydrolase 1 n=1 Tax=Ectopseudomonas mendocina TaxID=300 RepID=A0ABZ2RB69_ECTME
MRWLLVMAWLVCSLAHAQLDYKLEPRRIADGVWLVEGSTDNFSTDNGGAVVNVGFIETQQGVVVIDTGISKRYGEALRAAIGKVTDKPILKVILTHHHPDHAFGNQAFRDVPIAALKETTRLLAEQGDGMAENMYRIVGDWMRGTEVVLPTETVETGTVQIGGRSLQLLALRGHTGADLAILDEQTGVLFAGDILFYQRALTTPNTPGLDVWLADVDQLQALPWKQIVPGHGPLTTDDAPFVQMRDYLGWLDGLLRTGAEQGAEMNELIRAPIPERFAAVTLTRFELIRSVSHLYPRYESTRMERVDQ